MSHAADLKLSPGGSLAVTGPLAIQTVAEWRTRFLELFDAGGPIALDLGELGAIDVFGFQLLLSLRRSAAEAGRAVVFSPLKPELREACAAAGFDPGLIFPSTT